MKATTWKRIGIAIAAALVWYYVVLPLVEFLARS